jgi:methionyl-tRNA formyltransferase
MKILLFSGTHSRHLFIHKAILDNFDVVGVVCMQRESTLPDANPSWDERDKQLFQNHFKRRDIVETQTYGSLDLSIFDNTKKKIFITPSEISSTKVANFVMDVKAEVCLIFGVDLILDPVLGVLPKWRLNIHLGLSPWYRGSATLFWPFYFLQPQFAGATIHQILPEADAGDIVHQVLPCLMPDQRIHDVGAEVVKQTRSDVLILLERLLNNGGLHSASQKSSGRLFLTKDFEPHHLRSIYELYEDNIVNEWLEGKLGNRLPKIFNGLENNT